MPRDRRLRRAMFAQGFGLAGICLVWGAGCQGGSGFLSRWHALHDDVIAKPPTAEELGDQRGPIARLLTPEHAPARANDPEVVQVALPPPSHPEVEEQFRAAENLMQEGKLDEAERLLAGLQRKSERGTLGKLFNPLDPAKPDPKRGLFGERKRQSAWGEKALFLLAETQFRRGKLVAANDTLVKLLTQYPGTSYLDQAVQREYDIAVAWLDAINPQSPPEKREQWNDRLTGRLPAIDVSGHALQVLEHVRHHDPTGPLADDAVMRIADHHYQHGAFEEAALYYDQLITDHPKSALLQTAYERTIDAKMKAYEGPDYDVSGLEKAREQIQHATTLFPERRASTSDDLAHKLDLLQDQQAEITFRRGEFYKQTGYPGAAELCFGEVKARWPQSEWASKAEAELQIIAKMPRKKVEPSKIMTRPGAVDPFAGGLGSAAGGGAGLGGAPSPNGR